MIDWGISCAKRAYGRGVGKPMICDPVLEDYDAGLCYPPCKYMTDGVGPVCWGDCPNGTLECAGMLCLQPTENC